MNPPERLLPAQCEEAEGDYCCPACKDEDDDNYPFLCTTADRVLLSVCGSEGNSDGDEPLPEGFSCSTSPSHGVDGTYEVDNEIFLAPDCSQLEEDFADGRQWTEIWDEALNGEGDYGKISKSTSFLARAVLAGGEFYFAHKVKCAIVIEPTVGGGGSFGMYDSDQSESYDFEDSISSTTKVNAVLAQK